MSVNYCSGTGVAGCTGGGLNLKGLTVDIIAAGLRLGIPEITNGHINIRNFKINDSPINDVTLSNINVPKGGYIIMGSPGSADESSVNIDAYIASGTSLDYQLFDTSDSDVQVASAHVELSGLNSEAFFKAEKVSMNVHSGEGKGLRFDIGDVGEISNSGDDVGGLRGTLSATDIMLRPQGVAVAPVLGSVQLDLQILPGSYVEILGH